MTLTAKDVAEITKLLEESSFDELYLELDGVKLSLRRGGNGGDAPPAFAQTGAAAADAPAEPAPTPAPAVPGAPGAPAAPAPVRSSGSAAASRVAARPVPAATDPAARDVPAPLLGTFYRAPKPGAAPFVEVGSTVEEDTIVGIIEVMKLMNTVRAGVRGRVTEILARDGVLVEYGETLMRVGKTD